MAGSECAYPEDFQYMEVGNQLVMLDYVRTVVFRFNNSCTPLFKWQYLVNLILVIVWLVIGRWLYDMYMRFRRRKAAKPFSLATEITKTDNKAISIDFAAFLFSICWITRGSLTDVPVGGPNSDDAYFFGTFFAYQAIGCALILLARILNDKVALRKVDNVKAMVEDQNLGVACAQGGATIATAIIIAAAAGGVSVNFGEGVGASVLFWVIGQFFLLLYSVAYDWITSLPVVKDLSSKLVKYADTSSTHGPGAEGAAEESSEGTLGLEMAPTSMLKQAEAGNVAAGIALGCDMIQAAIIIAAPIVVGYSLLAWLIYVAAALFVVCPLMHIYLDHIIMRGVAYTVNILRHRNWGAAVLLGSLKILTALVIASLYRENCAIGDGYTFDSNTCQAPKLGRHLGEKLATVAVPNVFTWMTLLDLLLLFFLIIAGKAVYYLRFTCRTGVSSKTFSLDKILSDPKNNAVSISLALYIFAQGLGLVGSAYCPNPDVGVHGYNLLLWTSFGFVLLVLAFIINDCILLRKVSNTGKLMEDNVAIAIFEGGSFVSCGIILRANLTGSGSDETADDFGTTFALIAVYWLLSQIIMLLFAFVYRCTTKYNDMEELIANNAAAGIDGGATLVALAIAVAFSIMYYTSLLVFLPVAVVAALVLLILRFVVDRAILPGDKLDVEIKKDKNWGAALVETAVAIGIASILNMYIPIPGDIANFDVCPTY